MRSSPQACVLIGLVALAGCTDHGALPEPRNGDPAAPGGVGSGGVAGSLPATGVSSGSSGTLGGGIGGQGGATPAGAAPSGGTAGANGAAGSAGSLGAGGIAGAGGNTASAGTTGTSGAGGAGGGGSIPSGSHWKPGAGLSWQWQIGGGTIDPNLAVDVFDIDWEESAGTVDELHQAGKKVICYVSVGSWEDWRSDAGDFPAAVLGNEYPGWPGERFVDIRAQALRDVMASRLDACKAKGFDALEPDNMDVFGSDSGFALTEADGVDYAKWLATESHDRAMAIVQKNASEITSSIEALYDGALTEDCYADGNWCSEMQPYIDANKPVFACEYDASIFDAACNWGTPRMYSFILKDLDLNAPVTFCP